MLFTIAMLILLLFALLLHELGHAFAMRECGVGVLHISVLGWGGPSLRLPFKSKWLPDAEWVIHPLLPIGAYVASDAAEMERLSRADSNYISGMGPLANFIFALVLLALSVVIAPEWLRQQIGTSNYSGVPATLVVIALAIAILWWLRRFFCRFLLLPIGSLTFGLVLIVMVSMTSA